MSLLDLILGWFRRGNRPPVTPPANSSTLLAAINAYRAQHGRSHFVGDSCLDSQARNHAADVATNLARPHDGFIRRLSFCGKGGGGCENWAQASTPDEAVAMWASSVDHRANMLGGYLYCGSAIVGNSVVMICGNNATLGMVRMVLGKPIVDRSNERMTFAFVEANTTAERG